MSYMICWVCEEEREVMLRNKRFKLRSRGCGNNSFGVGVPYGDNPGWEKEFLHVSFSNWNIAGWR